MLYRLREVLPTKFNGEKYFGCEEVVNALEVGVGYHVGLDVLLETVGLGDQETSGF